MEFEHGCIRSRLEAHGGRIQETANDLGVDRSHLWKKLKRVRLTAS